MTATQAQIDAAATWGIDSGTLTEPEPKVVMPWDEIGGPVEDDDAATLTEGRDDVPGPQSEGYAAPPELKGWTAAELLTAVFAEPNWIAESLLPEGLAILHGPPKVGKSWLALQLALSVSTGGMFLDKPVKQGGVLYLAAEDSPRRLQDRMHRMAWPADHAGDCLFLDGAQFLKQVESMTGQGLAILLQAIRSKKYRIVVIDTLSRAMRGDQNDVSVVTAVLAPLQVAALEVGCCVLVIDHDRKSAGDTPDAVLDLGGSRGKSGTADTLLSLTKKRGTVGATLSGTGRDVEEFTLTLRHDATTGCWQVSQDTPRPSPQETAEEFLLYILADGPVAASIISERAKKADISERTLDRAKKDLGICSRRPSGIWMWSLPEGETLWQADNQSEPF